MVHLEHLWEQLDRMILARMRASRTPGLTVALFDRTQTVRAATYGFADLEAQRPVTADTLFEIGSITKSFTAVAVMQAVEQQLLDLDRPVTAYLPWFQVQSDYAPITLHHLLTHSAGLVGVIDRSPDIRGAVWALRETECAGPPGARFYYSDAGYQILTLILEEVYGRPFAGIIQENIFAPLGMMDSKAALTHAIRPTLARGYNDLYDDRPPHTNHPLFPTTWIETGSGDCCIASTAADMAKFGRMLLNGGQGPSSRLLSADGYARLIYPHISANWGGEYGYGLMIQARNGFTHIGHGGGMPGYTAEVIAGIEYGAGLVVLCNGPFPTDLHWKMLDFWRELSLGRPVHALDFSLPDPYHIENAPDFAGVYHNEKKTLTIAAENHQLILDDGKHQVRLESRDEDQFYADHPDYDRFLLRFRRAPSEDNTKNPTMSRVVELFYGDKWYVRDSYKDAREFMVPPEWHAYPGHYRAHIPWQTNFRILLRKDTLVLAWPNGNEELLIPHVDEKSGGKSDGKFYVGDVTSPERIQFDQIANGQALRAILSTCDYYRFFTP